MLGAVVRYNWGNRVFEVSRLNKVFQLRNETKIHTERSLGEKVKDSTGGVDK